MYDWAWNHEDDPTLLEKMASCVVRMKPALEKNCKCNAIETLSSPLLLNLLRSIQDHEDLNLLTDRSMPFANEIGHSRVVDRS